MSGNRKHGFLRGNGGSAKPSDWFCDGCKKLHAGNRPRNGTLDKRSLCNSKYYIEFKEN